MYKKILLIDDDYDEQFIFAEALEELNAGVKFFFASSAKEGIQMFSYISPDIVFIDINMPGMNGLECIEKLRACGSHCTLVIYSTGIDNIVCNKAREKGINACIKKQGSIGELTNLLRTILIDGQSPYVFE